VGGSQLYFVIAAAEFVTATASDLAKIGSTISAATATAATPTTAMLAAGEDEVSAAIAAIVGHRHSRRRG
jgi:hypothetical protein